MPNDQSPTISKTASPKWIAGRIETLLSHYYQPATNEQIAVAAMQDWIKALSGFSQGQISGACELYLRQEPKRRPTPADIRTFILDHRGAVDEGGAARGDKTKLTFDERALLETKILPTARRWLNDPALRDHGEQTLAFWGEKP